MSELALSSVLDEPEGSSQVMPINDSNPAPAPGPAPAPKPRRRTARRAANIVRRIDEPALEVQRLFQRFLLDFASAPVAEAPAATNPASQEVSSRDYVRQIQEMVSHDRTTLHVDFAHLTEYMQQLSDLISQSFYRFEPFLRAALQNIFRELHAEYAQEEGHRGLKDFYISFFNTNDQLRIRELHTDKIGQLISIEGTVTRTSEVRPELLFGTFACNECGEFVRNIEQQFKYTEPMSCTNRTCSNSKSWQLVTGESKFVDWQKIRVQESSAEIPPGSMPRTIDIIVRNESVERTKPGDKCVFIGSLIVLPDVAKLTGATKVMTKGQDRIGSKFEGVSGIRGMGVRELTYKTGFLACCVQPHHTRFGQVNIREDKESIRSISEEEVQRMENMRRQPRLYSRLARCIAPTIYGHEEVKRGILLMLFGGVHKTTPGSGIELRGDINICIVGDPSTAKSQFLKYVVSMLPRAVYTSGKASTAAGLTASVGRDPETGEFGIEAGALMLADNGICCIDEFDKMDPKDQVAIHEAMEQQTISIAKAGIQATLNARASILAAANPISGRYDRAKTLKQNVTLTPPIMSRFDLFYVVLDECNEEVDMSIAQRIIRVHQHEDEAIECDFDLDAVQRYISFARRLDPIVTVESKRLLASHYVRLRNNDASGASRSAYRITVRQLESMVRLSEALARLHHDPFVQPAYVEEAARLLRHSIIKVQSDDINLDAERDSEERDARLDTARSTGDHAQQEHEEMRDGDEGEQESKPAKNTLTFSEYQRIANMLVLHLRRSELDKDPQPHSRISLGNWYLEAIESEIESEEDLVHESDKIRRIIRRLVETDHVLLESAGNYLQVHPNYDTSNADPLHRH